MTQSLMRRLGVHLTLAVISSLVLAALCLANGVSAQTVAFFETGEEFVGPFPSWKDVKTDYGAKGDGVTDDTAAIEAAMRDLRDVPANAWVTLYFPAGTYRLTKTIKNERHQHTDWLGGQIIGEDPATTILSWNGPDGDWMWGLDAWYFKMSRLTFDGRKKAGAGLVRWNNFATYCELSDLWFKDIAGPGIRLGSGTTDHEGQAEHAVERCRFTRCQTGILTADWNTMDIYVWYCLFEDCGRGIHNHMGGYQAFENVFLRSKESDLSTQNNHVFNIVNNTSIGSKRFIGPFRARGYAQGNRIFDTIDPVAMPPLDVLIDNVIRSRPGRTAPCVAGPDEKIFLGNPFFVGNTYTVADPVVTHTRTRHLAQRIVDAAAVPGPSTVRLPGPPPNRHRKIFEVKPGTSDDAAELQRLINAAAAEPAGSHPVVHLPKGRFTLGRTVVVPPGKELQIIGDSGTENGTVLRWRGQGTGPGFKLEGPSRVTIRDVSFAFADGGADALVVENADQVGGRVFCDQVLAGGNGGDHRCHVAILVDGLEQSDLTYLNGGWGEFRRGGVVVRGGPMRTAGGRAPGQVALLLGALGNNEYRLIDVQSGGRVVAAGFRDETPEAGSLLDLGPGSAGAISVFGMSWAGTPSTTVPFINVGDFKGTLAYVGNAMGSGYRENGGSFFIRIHGDGTGTRLLAAANEFTSDDSLTAPKVWQDISKPPARALLINNVGSGVNQPKRDIANVADQVMDAVPRESVVLALLADIRALRIEPPSVRAAGVTDVKLFRLLIRVGEGRTGLAFRR